MGVPSWILACSFSRSDISDRMICAILLLIELFLEEAFEPCSYNVTETSVVTGDCGTKLTVIKRAPLPTEYIEAEHDSWRNSVSARLHNAVTFPSSERSFTVSMR